MGTAPQASDGGAKAGDLLGMRIRGGTPAP
jgi:hypothetical protein